MTRLLEITDLSTGYENVKIVHELSMSLSIGECVGLFGPNGHGKSTLLRCISGLLPALSGRVMFDGRDITGQRPSKIVSAGLVHSQQDNKLFGDMTVREILELASYNPRARKDRKHRMEQAVTLFPRLHARFGQAAKTLSGGERQMLSIGAALMCNPKLLILDEPTLGLSPRLKEELANSVIAIKNAGTPLVLVEQDVEFLIAATDRLSLIEHGKIVRTIDRTNAPDHDEIMRMYFGAAE